MATTTFDVSATAQGSNKEEAVSLQGAFQQYRNKRQVSFTVDLSPTTHSKRTLLGNLDFLICNTSLSKTQVMMSIEYYRPNSYDLVPPRLFSENITFLSLGYH